MIHCITTPRIQISIKLDESTLQRVDEVAKLFGMTRTAFIERACLKTLEDQEALLEEMEGESAVTAAVMDAAMNNKMFRRAVMKLAASHISDEEIEARHGSFKMLRNEARRRKASKKAEKKESSDD